MTRCPPITRITLTLALALAAPTAHAEATDAAGAIGEHLAAGTPERLDAAADAIRAILVKGGPIFAELAALRDHWLPKLIEAGRY